MKVLITGAGGFIGTHLVEDQLRRGRRTIGLDVNISGLEHLKGHTNLEVVQGNIKDEWLLDNVLNGVDRVYHLASVHLSIATADEEYRKVNVEATKKLLEISESKKVDLVVHCSSVGVYGKIKSPPADEQSPCAPESIYDITKLEGEREALSHYKKTGFPVVVIRPAWVYGPRCPRSLRLFRTIMRKRFFFVGDGRSLRHCIYVGDLVEAFELCGEHKRALGQVYNLADSEPVTIRDLVSKIAEAAGVEPPGLSVPFWVVLPISVVFETVYKSLGKEPPVSRRTLHFFTGNTSFDISKAKDELGWSPSTTLDEGLRLTYEWILDSERL